MMIFERINNFVVRKIKFWKIKRNLNLYPISEPIRIKVSDSISKISEMNIHNVQDNLDDEAVLNFSIKAEYEFYYPDYYKGRDMVRLKKIREHFIAARLLGLNQNDIYLDIASQYSPAPQIYERMFGCQVLRQDFEYPLGKKGRVIGGSAGNMPIEPKSVTKAAMHCSLEHFEGDEDVQLIHEIERVLTPGGIFVIAPLYISDKYLIFTQPSLYANLPKEKFPKFDNEARLFISGSNRHERYYDINHFFTRIVNNTQMKLTIHSFGNDLVCNTGQMRFVAVFKKA